jgi:ATP-dependent DNA helicase PIF1
MELIHGPGGTGKTTLIRGILPGTAVLSAMTGNAAVQLGGGARTLHSVLGLKPDSLDTKTDAQLAHDTAAYWKGLHTLIVDEASMLSAEVLDRLDRIGRLVHGRPEAPFGGLRLILAGDLFQLPPVKGSLLIKSRVWAECDPRVTALTKNWRQGAEFAWAVLLDQMRLGFVPEWGSDLLRRRVQAAPPDTPRIVTTRAAAERINRAKLEALGTPPVLFEATARRHYFDTRQRTQATVPPPGFEVTVAVGALVVVTANVSPVAGIANGTRGIVRAIDVAHVQVDVELLDGPSRGATMPITTTSITQRLKGHELRISFMPLILAWAVTVHRAQGMTLDAAYIDLTRSWEAGHAYVALSRVRSIAGLFLKAWSPRWVRRHPDLGPDWDPDRAFGFLGRRWILAARQNRI